MSTIIQNKPKFTVPFGYLIAYIYIYHSQKCLAAYRTICTWAVWIRHTWANWIRRTWAKLDAFGQRVQVPTAEVGIGGVLRHSEAIMLINLRSHISLFTIYNMLSSGRGRSDRRSPIRRLYACLCGSGLACKSGMSPPFPTNMAATFARFTQFLMIELPFRMRSMGPMCLCIYLMFLSPDPSRARVDTYLIYHPPHWFSAHSFSKVTRIPKTSTV